MPPRSSIRRPFVATMLAPQLLSQLVPQNLAGLRDRPKQPPSSILAAVIQTLIPCFTRIGIATVRTRAKPLKVKLIVSRT